jgi:hypothetical protein
VEDIGGYLKTPHIGECTVEAQTKGVENREVVDKTWRRYNPRLSSYTNNYKVRAETPGKNRSAPS